MIRDLNFFEQIYLIKKHKRLFLSPEKISYNTRRERDNCYTKVRVNKKNYQAFLKEDVFSAMFQQHDYFNRRLMHHISGKRTFKTLSKMGR